MKATQGRQAPKSGLAQEGRTPGRAGGARQQLLWKQPCTVAATEGLLLVEQGSPIGIVPRVAAQQQVCSHL